MSVSVDYEKELLNILVENGIRKKDVQNLFLEFLSEDKMKYFGIEDNDIRNLSIIKSMLGDDKILCKSDQDILEDSTIKDFILAFLQTMCDFNTQNYAKLIIKAINLGIYLFSKHIDLSVFYKSQNMLNSGIIRVLRDELASDIFELVGSLVKFSNFSLGVVSLAYYETLLLKEINRVHKEALIDPLSGLYNRLKFEELKSIEFSRTKRYKTPLSVCLMDIDNFKKINDNYGHFIGDEVIRNIGALLKVTTRKSDICIRWGGEEFLVLFTHTTIDEAFVACEKIRCNIENLKVLDGLKFTISLGLSEVLEIDNSLEDAIARADKSLYLAKAKGKNRTEV